MPSSAPLIITEHVTAALARLRTKAATAPVNMVELKETIKTPAGEHRHREQMTGQSIIIPGPLWSFMVTFSIETGHPAGVARHMSMSIMRPGRVPRAEAVWMVAEILGFHGGLASCRTWVEELRDGGVAVNAVQPISERDPVRA
jgi:hypothetical protein